MKEFSEAWNKVMGYTFSNSAWNARRLCESFYSKNLVHFKIVLDMTTIKKSRTPFQEPALDHEVVSLPPHSYNSLSPRIYRRLGGVVVSVLATGPKVRRFKPARGDGLFKGDKNPQHTFLRRGSKAGGPMS
jgi:hypothetical protein